MGTSLIIKREPRTAPSSVLPHIWGTDELKQKSPDGISASEVISS